MRRWEIGLAENIGGRSEQQDQAAAFVLDDARICLLVVADGMGGRPGGKRGGQCRDRLRPGDHAAARRG